MARIRQRMKSEKTYSLTEWDWFTLQMRLIAIESRGTEIHYQFDFDRNRRPFVLCKIYLAEAEKMISEKISKAKQLRFYKIWASLMTKEIKMVLRSLPSLRDAVDLIEDVTFRIMYSYGMGAAGVCDITGTKVVWLTNN